MTSPNPTATNQMPSFESASCPAPKARPLIHELFVMAGDRWSLQVVKALTAGPIRFTILMASIPGISHRMLTRTLRTLERNGLVSRTSFPESPPRVEYELTVLGTTLREPIAAFAKWTEVHLDEIKGNQDRYDN